MLEPSPIAILCSDLHISSLCPAARAEKDWFEVQARYLEQLGALALNLGDKIDGRLAVICAGDIFDRWNPNPETINFALQHLPKRMYAVPGQHDLPNHRISQMHRSGYGTLVEARKITDISGKSTIINVIPGLAQGRKDIRARGFGWEQEVEPETAGAPGIHLAVIHKYCWIEGKSYPGAPAENTPTALAKSLKGYDAAVFGDNHKGFMANAGKCNVINTGGFMRRKSDEVDYEPMVGTLMSDGTICTVPLDTTKDEFHAAASKRDEVPVNMADFIRGLEELGEHGMNFKEAVTNHLRGDDYDDRTKEIILKAIEA